MLGAARRRRSLSALILQGVDVRYGLEMPSANSHSFEHRAHRAQGIGKCHAGPAVEDAARGAQVGAHRHRGHHALGRERHELHAP